MTSLCTSVSLHYLRYEIPKELDKEYTLNFKGLDRKKDQKPLISKPLDNSLAVITRNSSNGDNDILNKNLPCVDKQASKFTPVSTILL